LEGQRATRIARWLDVIVRTQSFLSLTSSDEWLSAAALAERLASHGYWLTETAPTARLEYVVHQLEHLRGPDGQRYFASVQILDPRGRPLLLYKQARRIRQPSDRLSAATRSA
jgi:hypothetical protein